MWNRIKELLLSTKRPGMEQLISYMENAGFDVAPCSSKHHLATSGGLVEHSLNVYEQMVKLNQAFNAGISEDSIVICSLLHDLGKTGEYNKPNYVENILKSGKQSEAEPYKTNPELIYVEHEIRSLNIASSFIELSEEEAAAILYHNGLYGKLMSSFSHPKETPLMLITHWADMWACRVIEEDK